MNIPCENEWNEFDLFKIKDDECVIYSLYDEQDTIVYIGRNQSFSHRVIAHMNEIKNFKKIRYFMTSQEISENVEKELIQLYQPKFNKNKKRKVKNISPKPISIAPITIEDVRKFFIENDVDVAFFSMKSGYSEKMLKGILNGTIELKKRTAENMRCLMKVYINWWKNERATNGEVKAHELMKGE